MNDLPKYIIHTDIKATKFKKKIVPIIYFNPDLWIKKTKY